jgi:hypothetical protein
VRRRAVLERVEQEPNFSSASALLTPITSKTAAASRPVDTDRAAADLVAVQTMS